MVTGEPKYSDSQFQRDTLQRWGRSCHDLLSSSGRSSERDLGNIWMRRHPRPQIVVASQGLNNTRKEEVLCQLHQFKAGVRGVWPGPGQIRNYIINEGCKTYEGFTMTVLPVDTAPAILLAASIIGKFQGQIAPTTPSG